MLHLAAHAQKGHPAFCFFNIPENHEQTMGKLLKFY